MHGISVDMVTCEFGPTVELNSMNTLEAVAEIAPPTRAWSKHERARILAADLDQRIHVHTYVATVGRRW